MSLGALKIATKEAPQISPRLLAWIDGACHWKTNRRVGRNDNLLRPEAVIDQSENAISNNAGNALRASFASSGFAPAVLRFFDALLKLLTGDGRQQ